MQNRKTSIVQKLAMALLAAVALNNQSLLAADLTATPPVGAGFVVKNVPGTLERFRVQESGEVRIPGLLTAAPRNAVVCFDNISGYLGPCVPGTFEPASPCFDANNRFKDCGNGTVYDKTTGLMWERKENCGGINYSNPHCYENDYTWSAASPFTEPTGTLYSDFLEKLNDLKTPNDGTATPCFAGYCDWRIPTIGELRSILVAPNPACPSSPCIDAIFGPTRADFYWSSSSLASYPSDAWIVSFRDGFVGVGDGKGSRGYARAVRSGR